MQYIYIVIVVIIMLVLFEIVNEKNRKKELINRLVDNWGKRPDREYDDKLLRNITYYFNNSGCNGDYIDDITWHDLDMDNFYYMINNTSSQIGNEYLYYMLRKPCFSNEELAKRNDLIHMFSDDKEIRLKIQQILSKSGKRSRISIYEYIKMIMNVSIKNCFIHYVQAILVIVFATMIIFNVKSAVALTSFMVFINIVTYFTNKNQMSPFLDFFSYVISMSYAVDEFSKIKSKQLKSYIDEMNQINSVLKKVKKGSILLKPNSVTGSFTEIIMDYVKMIFHVDIIMFYSMLTLLQKNNDKILRLYEIIGYIDSMCATASYREYLNYYCEPQLTSGNNIYCEAVDLFHPFIEKPVSNSISTTKPVIITGSNASGKSTFIKTLAVNAILSQSLYTSISKEYRACFFKVFSSMALQDSLLGAESYYMVEIKSLKRILDANRSNAPVLCFVDEVLRGTNTLERIAASSQILLSLANSNTLCFAATHDIELTQILENHYDSYHFQEKVENDDVVFDYKLYEGPATSRNAIKLLGIIGYSKKIINKASEMANDFLNTGTWEKL